MDHQKNIQYQLAGLPFTGIIIGMTLCAITAPWMSRRAGQIPLPLIEPPPPCGPLEPGTPEALLKVVLPYW